MFWLAAFSVTFDPLTPLTLKDLEEPQENIISPQKTEQEDFCDGPLRNYSGSERAYCLLLYSPCFNIKRGIYILDISGYLQQHKGVTETKHLCIKAEAANSSQNSEERSRSKIPFPLAPTFPRHNTSLFFLFITITSAFIAASTSQE